MVPRSHLGPWLFWSPRNLVPNKFSPWEIWAPRMSVSAWICYKMIFMEGLNFSGPKFLRAQISWGPKKSGAQLLSDHFSYSRNRHKVKAVLDPLIRFGQSDWPIRCNVTLKQIEAPTSETAEKWQDYCQACSRLQNKQSTSFISIW